MIGILMTALVITFAIYLIKKKYDIKVVMFGSGIILMLGAIILQKELLPIDSSTGLAFFDIFKIIGNLFTKQLAGASFTLMLLFGYIAYMKEIGADERTVALLSKPLSYFKSKGALIFIFFLIGNALCIIIPSASSLSVLLMATAYPVLVHSGASPLAIAAVIATSATIAPTPIGADNLLASQALGMSVTDYVFNYHAKISIPVILVMAIAHYGWQKYLDHRDGVMEVSRRDLHLISSNEVPAIYAFLPMLPLLLMVLFHVIGNQFNLGISEVTFFSLIVSIACEMIRYRSVRKGSEQIQTFFHGMGVGLTSVVVQVVAALTFVEGLKIIGVIDAISSSINQLSGAGLLLMIVFCLLALFVGLLSGSGLALFYAFVEIMPSFAEAAGISAIKLAIPMQFVSHLVKSISPVSPTVIIISSMMKIPPTTLIKRTVVPVIVGMILSILLTYVLI